jgi:hypothetical protein
MDKASLAAIEKILKNLATEKVEASTQTEILLDGFERVIYAIPPVSGKRVRTEVLNVKTPSSTNVKTPSSHYSWKSEELTPISVRRTDSDSSIVIEHKGHTVLAKMHYKGQKHWWKPKYRIKNSGESWDEANNRCELPIMSSREKISEMLKNETEWRDEYNDLTTLQLFCLLKRQSPGCVFSGLEEVLE